MTEFLQAIGVMSVPDLMAAARAAIDQRVEELQTVKANELREKWASEAAALGLDAEVLLHGRRGKGGRGRRSSRNSQQVA